MGVSGVLFSPQEFPSSVALPVFVCFCPIFQTAILDMCATMQYTVRSSVILHQEDDRNVS